MWHMKPVSWSWELILWELVFTLEKNDEVTCELLDVGIYLNNVGNLDAEYI